MLRLFQHRTEVLIELVKLGVDDELAIRREGVVIIILLVVIFRFVELA